MANNKRTPKMESHVQDPAPEQASAHPVTPGRIVESTRERTETLLDPEDQLTLLAKSAISIANIDQIIPLILRPETRDKAWAQITLDKLISTNHHQIYIIQALEHSGIPKDDPFYEKTFKRTFEYPFKDGSFVIQHFWEWLKEKTWAEPLLTRYLQLDSNEKSAGEILDTLLSDPVLAQRVLVALGKTNSQFVLTNLHKFLKQPWADSVIDAIPDSHLEKRLSEHNSRTFFTESILPIPKLALKIAKKSPRLFLTLAQNLKDIPDNAEPAFTEAAKQDPRQALLCSTFMWEKSWGQKIVEKALAEVKLGDFEPDALKNKPWYPRLGLRLMPEPKANGKKDR